jgi:hypothetical protein
MLSWIFLINRIVCEAYYSISDACKIIQKKREVSTQKIEHTFVS